MTQSATSNPASTFPGAPPLRTIVSPGGEAWLTYRKTLEPRYWIAWAQIALCLGGVGLGIVGASVVNAGWGTGLTLLLAPLMGVWIGYWLHPLMLFGHEAAHYHLARQRSTNDWLANTFLLSLLGLDIKLYRKVHWQHHLHLGDTHDTEVSYHHRPSLWFIVQAFTGIYPLKALLGYYRSLTRGSADAAGPPLTARERRRWFLALARTALIHLSLLTFLTVMQWYGAAVTWLLGLVVFFPAFNMLRQILEHRAVDARDGLDYREIEHGPVNRMFPSGPFSSTFGGAGFNRHLLHHWDPGISFTRFRDMESFLLQCQTQRQIEAARTTYWHALRALIREEHDG